MKYEKANDVLPEDIVHLIQQYIDGSYLYIPRKNENKKAWGEDSGIKRSLKKRNMDICALYKQGRTVRDLANHYYLTEPSIRRIIRQEKNTT